MKVQKIFPGIGQYILSVVEGHVVVNRAEGWFKNLKEKLHAPCKQVTCLSSNFDLRLYYLYAQCTSFDLLWKTWYSCKLTFLSEILYIQQTCVSSGLIFNIDNHTQISRSTSSLAHTEIRLFGPHHTLAILLLYLVRAHHLEMADDNKDPGMSVDYSVTTNHQCVVLWKRGMYSEGEVGK